MAAEQPPLDALRDGDYIKSSRSPQSQPDCVMLYATDGWIGVQDSKEYPDKPKDKRTTLGFTKSEFTAFLEGAKNGEFDHLIA
ncbi:hypothetical protein BAY61_31845 (plasmid) [Prauserella marina]|uniref:Uncharacterized protein n=1 Tax=Prauserella marina TaxID=530584 RepID=A0A222W168_9PSEU|nr:DUF397 domain-containing protein [Prauserella marina]ASR39880.1 hypothetical protein BAY61_31845 [Prauserella marina]PWV71375.1 uncharacterized protein DUF397 [Prauserella marina]SDD95502.1 protein of unknown function [Prauserella marina]